jgi:ATP-dependent helicase HrpB
MTTAPASRSMGDSTFDLRTIGQGLPAAALTGQLAEVFANEAAPRLVVEAPPGSGKTTLVPPALAMQVPGRVVVTEPRRLAARAAARRLAHLTGTRLGELAGYSVRGDRVLTPTARVEFVTGGLLLRRILADPELAGTGAVILDEVHERGLDSDLVFALVHQIAQLRGDLSVTAMSATLDAQRWARLLGAGSHILRVPMRPHPLQLLWIPPDAGIHRIDERGVSRAFLTHVADVTQRTYADHPDGSLLVFLPGRHEVEAVTRQLTDAGLPALPLYGTMPAQQQDQVLSDPGPGSRRIIVSTPVAESSLTVPGVRIVVDAGLAREPRLDTRRGLSGLVTVPASRASAQQRAGRAARLGPGLAVRCYTQQSLALAPAEPRPEMATVDLTGAALALALWGDPNATDLSLPDPPPPESLAAAQRTLLSLGGLQEDTANASSDRLGRLRVTERGRRIAQIPAHPRLARALLDGAQRLGAHRAAELVAALNSDGPAPHADLTGLLRALRRGGTPDARQWKRDTQRFTRLLSQTSDATASTGTSVGTDTSVGTGTGAGPASEPRPTDEEALGLLIALGWPEQIARRRDAATAAQAAAHAGPPQTTYLLASGTAAALPRDTNLGGSPWLAVAQAARAHTRDATGAIIRAAAPITETTALHAGATLVQTRLHTVWKNGRLHATRTRTLGAIELAITPIRLTPRTARSEAKRLLSDPLHPLEALHWGTDAQTLRARLALLHRQLGDPWPDMRLGALAGRLDDWLSPELDRLAAGASLSSLNLTASLRRLLPWPDAAQFDMLAPEQIQVPSGSRIRVQYPDPDDPDASPILAVKLQECFGWEHTPRLVDGRVPVLLHLLSPAQRPLAITDDLASFWENAYPQVRAEMRGRYPKHPWPEDPRSAGPTRRTTHPHRPER